MSRPVRRSLVLAASASLLAGCVTVILDDEDAEAEQLEALAQTVTIPIGEAPSSAERPLVELYEGVLRRMRQAYVERDLAMLYSLLGAYDREHLPSWARERIAGYRALAAGLSFELHARFAAKLTVPAAAAAEAAPAAAAPDAATPAPDPAAPDAAAPPPMPEPGSTIGEPLRFELALPADGEPTQLAGGEEEDAVSFAISVDVEDRFADGSARWHKDHDVVRLPATLVLAGDMVLRLPVLLELPDSGAVRRTVRVRVDLWGHVARSGQRAPVQRTTIATATQLQHPAGHATLRTDPMRFLREAMRIGDEPRFRTVAVAAAMTAGEEREQALALLIDWVRLGSPDRSQVAQATLQELTGATIAVGDRDGWLAWWQERR